MAVDGWAERWDQEKTLGRLLWIKAIKIVYGAGLGLLGITALERMEPLEDRTQGSDNEDRQNEEAK